MDVDKTLRTEAIFSLYLENFSTMSIAKSF